MQLIEIIRQSARGLFDPERAIPKEDMEKILEAARWAPTAHNMQNFEIVVVDDKKSLAAISEIKRILESDFHPRKLPSNCLFPKTNCAEGKSESWARCSRSPGKRPIRNWKMLGTKTGCVHGPADLVESRPFFSCSTIRAGERRLRKMISWALSGSVAPWKICG